LTCKDHPVYVPDPDAEARAAARVVVAAPNRLAAQAGASVGARGRHAVDAALAAMLVTLVTSRAWSRSAAAPSSPSRPPAAAVTVDGYVEMPGRGLPPSAFRHGTRDIYTPSTPAARA
jgi:gamma-glutamyltranspeptidase/glutathione hydrolase